ncbi:hypothetical protein Z045_22735 [Rhodococcus pyridinivorans KG-16]|uniref:Uncharacterized protein n=1 Tax=Rhodococcus pyridinivorans KG-16 TaxID=1441730 RepID=A0A0V9UF13_9NOCA|nr:hypothetical protein Z045_22735 [Rhodococcus pyridinivorans KG-16]
MRSGEVTEIRSVVYRAAGRLNECVDTCSVAVSVLCEVCTDCQVWVFADCSTCERSAVARRQAGQWVYGMRLRSQRQRVGAIPNSTKISPSGGISEEKPADDDLRIAVQRRSDL